MTAVNQGDSWSQSALIVVVPPASADPRTNDEEPEEVRIKFLDFSTIPKHSDGGLNRKVRVCIGLVSAAGRY